MFNILSSSSRVAKVPGLGAPRSDIVLSQPSPACAWPQGRSRPKGVRKRTGECHRPLFMYTFSVDVAHYPLQHKTIEEYQIQPNDVVWTMAAEDMFAGYLLSCFPAVSYDVEQVRAGAFDRFRPDSRRSIAPLRSALFSVVSLSLCLSQLT